MMNKSLQKIIKTIALFSILIILTIMFISSELTVENKLLGSAISDISSNGTIERYYSSPIVYKESKISKIPDGFILGLENESLSLFYRKETGEIALMEKSDGMIWFSNPQDRANDKLIEGASLNKLAAQFSMTYSTTSGRSGAMDSVNDCIVYNNLTMNKENDKITATYIVGKQIVSIDDVPQQISAERYISFTSKLTKEKQAELLKNYNLATIKGISDKTAIEKFKYKYPKVGNNDIYYLTSKSDRLLKIVKDLWDETGYTIDDLIFDNKENEIKSEAKINPNFTIVIDYRLDKNTMVVEIDSSKLKYNSEIPINTISLLEYFGSASKEESGYFFVADGSGGIINFNNNKKQAAPFSMKIYGLDAGIKSQQKSDIYGEKQYMLPVYGISKDNHGLFIELDKGEEYASILARTSGMLNSYNNIYAEYQISQSDKVSISNSKASEPFILNADKNYEGLYRINYTVMSKGKAQYDDMALLYKQRLIDRGDIEISKTAKNSTNITILGGVKKRGVFFDSLIQMTDYSEVVDFSNRLIKMGFSDYGLLYSGWTSNGLQQSIASSIKISNTLGGKKNMTKLINYANGLIIPLAFETSVLNIFNKGYGFNMSNDNIRYISGDIAISHNINLESKSSKNSSEPIYQLKPSLALKITDSLAKQIKNQGIKQLALSDLGTVLNSDFDKDSITLRDSSKNMIKESLKKLSEQFELSISKPNMYSLKYAGSVYNLPISCSLFEIEDASVPFYQILISGYIPYTSEPLNYHTSMGESLLEAMEFGSACNLLISASETSLLKQSDYNKYYTGSVSDYIGILPYMSEQLNVISKIKGLKILSHIQVAENTFKTSFESGYDLYVNYGNTTQNINGIEIKPFDYILWKEVA